jgi:hypothetical protein
MIFSDFGQDLPRRFSVLPIFLAKLIINSLLINNSTTTPVG